MIDSEYFGKVPLWLLTETDASPTAVCLFALIGGKYANRTSGQAFPGRSTLARDLRVDVRTIARALNDLRRVGALKIGKTENHSNGWDRNLYTLVYQRRTTPAIGPDIKGTSKVKNVPRVSSVSTDMVDPKDKNVLRIKDTSVLHHGTPLSHELEPGTRSNLTREPRAENSFALDAANAERPEAQKAANSQTVIGAYMGAWKDCYGVKAPAPSVEHTGRVKQLVADYGAEQLAVAAARYVASTDDAYVVKAKHPFGLFLKSPATWMVEAQTPNKTLYVPSDERTAEIETRADNGLKLRQDAASAIDAMDTDARAALEDQARNIVADRTRRLTIASERIKALIATAMVEELVAMGKGRSMADTANAFAQQARKTA